MRLGSLAAGQMEGRGAGNGTMTSWTKGLYRLFSCLCVCVEGVDGVCLPLVSHILFWLSSVLYFACAVIICLWCPNILLCS